MGKRLFVILVLSMAFCFISNTAYCYYNRVLILFDDPSTTASQTTPYLANQRTLYNLTGHFGLPFTRRNVHSYVKGEIDKYRATFYIGNKWRNPLPSYFLEDVLKTIRPVVWINFNLDKIAASRTYKESFESKFGIQYRSSFKSNPYDRVHFLGEVFQRQQERICHVKILNSQKAVTKAYVTNGTIYFPYVVKSTNFYYIADNPMDVWSEDQAYIIFAELIHEQVGIIHAVNHRALVRIEDVNPESDPESLRNIADYLHSENVPFSISVIPRFTDPLGATGTVRTIDLNDKPEVISALNYMVSLGGTIIMHGLSHQYDSVINPYNGVTGNDSEFFIQRIESGKVINVSAVPEDSEQWVRERLNEGFSLFSEAGFQRPLLWETPHYLASDLDYEIFGNNFNILYERKDKIYFPYVVYQSIYGAKIVPENCGCFSPGVVDINAVVNRADKNLVVKDGFASFFFHPYLDVSYLQLMINGIKAKGYTFVSINSL